MNIRDIEYVAVNFLFQLIFVFPLFLGMVMHANEFETKEKQKLTEINCNKYTIFPSYKDSHFQNEAK